MTIYTKETFDARIKQAVNQFNGFSGVVKMQLASTDIFDKALWFLHYQITQPRDILSKLLLARCERSLGLSDLFDSDEKFAALAEIFYKHGLFVSEMHASPFNASIGTLNYGSIEVVQIGRHNSIEFSTSDTWITNGIRFIRSDENNRCYVCGPENSYQEIDAHQYMATLAFNYVEDAAMTLIGSNHVLSRFEFKQIFEHLQVNNTDFLDSLYHRFLMNKVFRARDLEQLKPVLQIMYGDSVYSTLLMTVKLGQDQEQFLKICNKDDQGVLPVELPDFGS